MNSILLIEDDDLFRALLARWLRLAGYSVTEASDGRQGVHVLAREPIDLVLTDLVMPEQEGIATIIQLRRDLPSLPIVAMSGGGRGPVYLDLAKKLGARATLRKPFSASELSTVIAALLAGGGT